MSCFQKTQQKEVGRVAVKRSIINNIVIPAKAGTIANIEDPDTSGINSMAHWFFKRAKEKATHAKNYMSCFDGESRTSLKSESRACLVSKYFLLILSWYSDPEYFLKLIS